MELTRRLLLTALGAGTAAAVTGCGTGSSSGGSAGGPAEGEISLLTPIFEGSDGKKLLEQEILGGFRKKHPDVKVNVDYTTYTQLNEKITTALAGGLLPDVLMMGVGWIPPFAAKKVLAPLPESLATRHDYEPRVLEPSRYDGKLYALPTVMATRLVAYRKDHFAAAGIKKSPRDWTELRAMAKQLTKGDRLGFDPFSIDLRQCWETFLYANGGSLFSADGKRSPSPTGEGSKRSSSSRI
ncbi:ABC transporter substrate-binding protein [Streptomyces aureus]|uniref:ABC transporter substrate-binding protein n=1 Tax=Streptomyces aureus TaxID=193461 RepID=UPI0036453FE6